MTRCHALYVFLAFSLDAGCGSAGSPGPAETVEEFYRLINEGNCGEVTERRWVRPAAVAAAVGLTLLRCKRIQE